MLGEEHKKTLDSMDNMGVLLHNMEDYEGSLDYKGQARRVREKVLGKTHPSTLMTIMNMASTYDVGLKDFSKAEEMFKLALDGYEKALGKENEDTKRCAKGLAIFYITGAPSKEKLRKVVTDYPHLLTLAEHNMGMIIRNFLRS